MKHSHVFMRFPGGLSKALSFTFDDGSEQDERLVGLLAENGLLATFNLNMGLLPPDDSFDFSTLDRAVFPAADWCQRRMSRAAIGRVFAESGMELACHGYLHADLSKLDDEGVLWEIMRDRAALEELTGESVRGFAYPQGAYDERIAGLVRSAGFEYARTAGSAHGFDLPRGDRAATTRRMKCRSCAKGSSRRSRRRGYIPPVSKRSSLRCSHIRMSLNTGKIGGGWRISRAHSADGTISGTARSSDTADTRKRSDPSISTSNGRG